MDNLTHSMLGALLGQTGLKRKSGLGMAALVIGANIPDIDGFGSPFNNQWLAYRRGLTHGPIAMLVLPLLLTGLLILYDRWQGARGSRPETRLPVRPGWLLLLAFIGTLSHPLFDWFNSYGVRLLEPFSHRWFYGDMLFIIDVTLLILLVGGFFWSRRAEKRGIGNWRRRGAIAVAAVCAYVFANGVITGVAEARATRWLTAKLGDKPAQVVADPVRYAFWRREILWRTRDGRYGAYGFDVLAPSDPDRIVAYYANMDDPRILERARHDGFACAFLFWSRLPVAHFRPDGTLVLTDQRYSTIPANIRATAIVPPSGRETSPADVPPSR